MKKRAEWICFLILLLGFISRIVYVTKVVCYYSPHDIGSWVTEGNLSAGHMGYIQYLYVYKSIPQLYVGQFYHPPLFHLAGAMIVAITQKMGFELATSLEAIQTMNMVMSCLATIFAYKILKLICKEDKFIIPATTFITFCPAFYIIGAEINNDCFMTTFQIMAVYYTMLWMEKSTIANILKIALAICAAMLSKTSGGLIALSIGLCFLYVLWENKKEWKKYFKQYFIFGILCIPLGLSWCIYHKILFGIPFNYVLELPKELEQYIPSMPIWNRLGFPYHMLLDYARIDFTNPAKFCNVWTQMFYTMNFDEGLILVEGNALANVFYQILFYGSVLFTLIQIAILFRNMISKKVEMKYKILFLLNYIIMIAMFAKFSFDYSFICTMNFRYIVVTQILLIASYGLYYSRIRKSENKDRHNLIRYRNLLHEGIILWIKIGSISMVLLYLVCPRV